MSDGVMVMELFLSQRQTTQLNQTQTRPNIDQTEERKRTQL